MSLAAPEAPTSTRPWISVATRRTPESARPELPAEPTGQQLVVVQGDPGTSKRMLDLVLQEVLPATEVPITLVTFDLSISARRKDKDAVPKAAEKMREVGFGIKSSTISPDDEESKGLPNANIELRRETGATAIVRTARPIRGVTQEGGAFTVVRYADDLAEEDRDKKSGKVTRTEIITPNTSKHVAEYAFQLAESLQNPRPPIEPESVVVLYGSRAANNRESYGVFDKAVEEAHTDHPSVPYEAMSVEEFYRRLPRYRGQQDPRHFIIPAMEEAGDNLSNLALGLLDIPIGTVPSTTIALDEDKPKVVWTDTMHGIGRRLDTDERRAYANPMATILALADVLFSMQDNPKARFAGYYMRRAAIKVAESVQTPDMGGNATTKDFIDALKHEMR